MHTTALARLEDVTSNAEQILVASFLTNYKKQTRATNAINIAQFANWCHANGITLLQARRPHIEAYARYLEEAKGYKVSTIANKINSVRQLYKTAHRDELIDDNPAQWVKPPSVPAGSEREYLTKAELLRVLDYARLNDAQDHALLALMGYTGLRVGEVCALDVEHLGARQYFSTIRVRREKGNDVGDLPLNPRVQDALRRHVGSRKAGPLFLNANEERMDRRAVDRVIERCCRAVGITKNITPHSFRHTFITIACDEGVLPRDLKYSMGYASTKMIDRVYDHHGDNLAAHATHKVFAAVEAA